MENMIAWNWPNWITVVLMVALGYLVVSLAAQLIKGKMPGVPAAASGSGQSTSQKNFAGIFGQSEFSLPGAR